MTRISGLNGSFGPQKNGDVALAQELVKLRDLAKTSVTLSPQQKERMEYLEKHFKDKGMAVDINGTITTANVLQAGIASVERPSIFDSAIKSFQNAMSEANENHGLDTKS